MNVNLNMTRMGRAIRLLAMLSILLASRAFGQPFTETESTTFSGSTSALFSNGLNLSLPAFNTEDGYLTLTGVEIEMDGFMLSDGIMTVSNTNPPGAGNSEIITASFVSNYTLSDPLVTGTSSPTMTSNLQVQTGNFVTPILAPGQSDNNSSSPLSSAASGPESTNVSPTYFSDYEVTGTNPTVVTLTVTALSGIQSSAESSSGAAGVAAIGTTMTNGEVEIIYTYVPEPQETASWVMGFVVCLLVGRIYLRNRGSLNHGLSNRDGPGPPPAPT